MLAAGAGNITSDPLIGGRMFQFNILLLFSSVKSEKPQTRAQTYKKCHINSAISTAVYMQSYTFGILYGYRHVVYQHQQGNRN